MASIALDERDNPFDSLIAKAESGETIVFTRSGQPVAQLQSVPRVSSADAERARVVLKSMDEHAKEMNLGPFDWEEWKAYRDEGRR
jgi:antitoxin (DNA-binding transcriptional repressor) of toxin-antitoxin stability system